MECRDDHLVANENPTPNADSRQYRFAYELHGRPDVPSDFAATPLNGHWQAALFVPGDTEAFWQPPEYPPRIYVLRPNCLMIYPHPASGEELFETPLEQLLTIELQKSLLYGIVQFHTGNASVRFRYSTVHQKLLDRFLRRLRSQWLAPAELNAPVVAIEHATHHSSARCVHELESEIDANECLHEQYRQPAAHLKEQTWLFKRSRILPALLVAITNRRVLAISTGAGDRNDPYELAIRYASLQCLSALEVIRAQRGSDVFQIRLQNQVAWNYAVQNGRSASLSSLVAIADELAALRGDRFGEAHNLL